MYLSCGCGRVMKLRGNELVCGSCGAIGTKFWIDGKPVTAAEFDAAPEAGNVACSGRFEEDFLASLPTENLPII